MDTSATHEIAPVELKFWQKNNYPFKLIDIREEWERAKFNIGGLHIPFGELISRRSELPLDTPVVLYCEKGIRSTIAIQRLEGMGFHNLYNLTGGMTAWKATL